ncbi:MAG: DNA polymerase/3'-5' exonuclease PolX [Candidatus Atribacteria bacterium]|nr:DNA polymerase/3'-5' exonuclease PolX [Candidatus Atribacteria bacterium]MCD6349930.1 DNA polymerase/3'-5' exonuclease PolX [Candidatus Atribacteria bacterium]
MRNQEVAKILRDIATLLEIKGENRFRVVAYEEAARRIESWPEPIEEVWRKGELTKVPGIGASIAAKISEYLETGKMQYLEELTREVPPELIELTKVPGVGPKLAKLLYEELGIKSLEDLEKSIAEKKLRNLPRLGVKSEEKIKKGLEMLKRQKGRLLLGQVLPVVEEIVALLKEKTGVENISPAGSVRRMKETIGDIDILVASSQAEKIINAFVTLPLVREVLAKGITKSSVVLHDGLQVDLRVVEPISFGAALQYFTGSKAHNIRLREIAIKKNLKVNEYGVFRIDNGQRVGGEKEEEIYEILGMEWIPPELREDQGEIEAALEKRLPVLIELSDIKGDLHVHSRWSDGLSSIEEMAEAALKRGYQYLAICDHTQSLAVASGLGPEELKKRDKEIQRWNAKGRGLSILSGVEANILSDGSLDLPQEVLSELDVVIGGLHSGLNQSKDKIMMRLQKAMHNLYVQIISHPTGRLINKREAYNVDLDKLLAWAARTGTFLEINAQPERLDLRDIDARKAKESFGLKMVISTDAHEAKSLDYMRLGVAQARRAWLTAEDVLNTYSLEKLLDYLSRKRKTKAKSTPD